MFAWEAVYQRICLWAQTHYNDFNKFSTASVLLKSSQRTKYNILIWTRYFSLFPNSLRIILARIKHAIRYFYPILSYPIFCILFIHFFQLFNSNLFRFARICNSKISKLEFLFFLNIWKKHHNTFKIFQFFPCSRWGEYGRGRVS